MSSYGDTGPMARALDTPDSDFYPLNEQYGSVNTSYATQRNPQLVGYAASSNQSVVNNSVPPSAPSHGQPLHTRESLQLSAEKLIAELNEKRRRDTQLLCEFRKSLENQVNKNCAILEQRLYSTYERQNKVIQSKLQELLATLDRIGKLEKELLEFRQGLQVLCQEMQKD